MWTHLGPTQSALIRQVSLFQGWFHLHEIRSRLNVATTLEWISYSKGVCKAGFPLYMYLDVDSTKAAGNSVNVWGCSKVYSLHAYVVVYVIVLSKL